MKVGQLSVPLGIFVACASASVTTADRRPARGEMFPTTNTAFASDCPIPSDGGKGLAEAPADAVAIPEHAILVTSTSQGEDSALTTAPTAPAPSPPGNPPTLTDFRLPA